MVNSHQTIVIIFTLAGALLAIGLCFFIDGVEESKDLFDWTHIIPVFMSLFTAFFVNFTSPSRAEENPIKVFLFINFTVSIVAIGVSIYITVNEYPIDANYPGVTIIIQTMLTFLAGMIAFIGRASLSDDVFSPHSF